MICCHGTQKQAIFHLFISLSKKFWRESKTAAPRRDVPLDVDHVIRLLLVHDLVEIEAGDVDQFDELGNKGQEGREAAAARNVFGKADNGSGKRLRELWEEFSACTTAEAKFARAIDTFLPLYLNVIGDGKSWNGFRTTRSHYIQ